MFMTTVIKCLSLNNDMLNANMTLFKMSLLVYHNASVSLS